MGKKAETPKVATLSQFTANSITIRLNGEDVVVALDKQENAFLNMVLAAQGRDLIQRAVRHWHENQQIPSPKELRDIAGAMKDIAAFSAEVYASAEPVQSKTPQENKEEDINFEDLTKPVSPNGNEASKAGSPASPEKLSGSESDSAKP